MAYTNILYSAEKGIFEMDNDFQIKKEKIEGYLNNLNISTNLERRNFEEHSIF